jgi:hypothetical protein
MKTLFRLTLVVFVIVWIGCERVISAEDYDRSCMQNEQCMLILVGPVCSCDCSFSAINSKDGPQYLEDRGDITCDEDCAPCQAGEPWCDDGTCEIR